MKRLLASKMGFVLLVVSVFLIGAFVATTRVEIYSWAPLVPDYLHLNIYNGTIDVGAKDSAGPTIRTFGGRIKARESAFNWSRAAIPRYYHHKYMDGGTATSLCVPIWLLLLPTVLASWTCYRRAFRRKRLVGHCPNCDYDLTGNTSGVCPECGEKI